VRQPLRRHPPAHQKAITEHVAAMLEQGVIEPAQSSQASNIVLVKKDGSLRCCVDYRSVNQVTSLVAYPLPRTDISQDAMAGAQWFSTFDLRSSYHQVKLKPEDRDKTTFIYRLRRFLPFYYYTVWPLQCRGDIPAPHGRHFVGFDVRSLSCLPR